MEIVKNIEDIDKLKENKIIGNIKLVGNSQIKFNGKDNVLYVDKQFTLINTVIDFFNSNGCFYVGQVNSFKGDVQIGPDSFMYFGSGFVSSVGNGLIVKCDERKNIIIGNYLLCSYNNEIRVTDGHLMYDLETGKRINQSKSIFMGDNVWLANNVTINKGCMIGSGTTIGNNAVVAGKRCDSHTVWVGNPAKKIRENVFISQKSPIGYTQKELDEAENIPADIQPYKFDENTVNFYKLEQDVLSNESALKRSEFLHKFHIETSKYHNRFYVGKEVYN
ncbi:MAG: hypothetical protein LBM93_16035 [Oscillospiraceae bacterium]|jgi:acetyltransferase-like isoleucine patch superfamily enzyme|nr:hypothetical protein [Oscillospiraceae bacterium]